MAANYNSILSDWKKGNFDPVYLFHGDEEYFIDELVSYAEHNILDEGEKAFNQMVLYGKEITYQNILDNAYQFPMMSRYRLIIVKEMQEMNSVDGLEIYFEKPSEQTILILAHKHKKLDGRKKIWKTAKKTATVFESKKLYENKIPDFILKQFQSRGIKIESSAAHIMANYLGADLSKVNNEIKKLALSKAGERGITNDDIHEQIGMSKEFNVFEFMNALGEKDPFKSFQIADYFGENHKRINIIPILGALVGFYQKVALAKDNSKLRGGELASKLGVSPYFVNQYISASRKYSSQQIRKAFFVLKEIDLKSKGVNSIGVSQHELLREMVFKLLS